MKFIHAADLHLDSPFLGLTNLPNSLLTVIRQSTFAAVTKVFDRAISEHVDFVVLAGDLFDRSEQSVAAQAYLFEQFDRLRLANIPVFVIFGNHDFLADQHQPIAYPENVHVFGATVETKTLTTAAGETVALSGFSYPQRWVEANPLAAFPNRAATDWHLGLLHGAIKSGSQDHYAPFTRADLLSKRYDYWALGHIHQHQILNTQPPVVYAGNTQGRSINETGAKGAYLVESDGTVLVPHFFETTVIGWDIPEVMTTSAADLPAVGQALTQWVTTHATTLPTLTALSIQAPQLVPTDLHDLETDWLALYQRTHARLLKEHQRYFIRLNVALPESTLTAPQLDQQYWEAGAATVFTPENLRDLFGKLAQEPALAEWFEQSQTQTDLKRLTEQQIATLMGKADSDVS